MRGSKLWIYVLLAVVTITTFAQVFDHEVVSGLDPGNPRLPWLSSLLGTDSGRYQLVSVLLHAVSVLLLFTVIRSMTGAVYRSAFVAFAFALHPLQVESVAWTAQRQDVLGGLFFFLTLWTWLSYVQKPAAWRYLLTTVAFVCGLLLNPTLITLPLILLLLDVWPLKRFDRRAILEKIPLALVGIASAVIAFLVEEHIAGFDLLSISLRIENAPLSYLTYLLKFIWPSNLAVVYPHPDLTWWKAALAAAALVAITIAARRRSYLTTGWLWFLITLLPVIGQARADRYTYLPVIGLAIMLAWSAAEFLPIRYAAVAGAAICAAWTVVAWQQIATWQNSATLFRHAVESTDGNYFAYNALGAVLRDQGHADEAIADFESAVRSKPHFADAQENLGESLSAAGRVDEAIPHLIEAQRLQPNSADAHINLGLAFHKAGRSKEAESEFRAALLLRPKSAEAHGGLGLALMAQGRAEEAVPYLTQAVGIHPADAETHHNLGNAYGALGRLDDAINQFSDAVRLNPSDPAAHYTLGNALVASGRMPDAATEFAAALKLDPDSIGARFNLASALASTGHLDEAIAQFTEVLIRQPDLAAARRSLERCRMLKKSSR